MIIAIGNDHAAVALKNTIVEHLKSKGHEVLDLGIGKCRFIVRVASIVVSSLDKIHERPIHNLSAFSSA